MTTFTPHTPAPDRHAHMPHRRCGRSGLHLPALSLALSRSLGDNSPFQNHTALIHHAFDRGITHFDLAPQYGPPQGAAEKNFGRVLAGLRPWRDELIVSVSPSLAALTGFGSRKHMRASLDATLRRTGLEYVDIYYAHRPDPRVPLEETMEALATAVHEGKALYVGLSGYAPATLNRAAAILADLGSPPAVCQASYSLLNQWVTEGLLDVLTQHGVGLVAGAPLAHGALVSTSPTFPVITSQDEAVEMLADIAQTRGQSLPQLALSWLLHDTRVTTVLSGASTAIHLEENRAAVERGDLTPGELVLIADALGVAGVEGGVRGA
ncbi:aldo/keto reductase [Streptomyces sp. NBC_01304]|uniref:aldo/keto reductase n=1 Tax=Streptomyces sp. NBC_01304 TaxID=2903818 RepID=UPI002E155D4A|nr:aldo/keto reductase [Streptomyces sp. NBC_01304]